MESNVKEFDGDPEEELEDPEELLDENGNSITDWKAIAIKNTGIGQRYQTKYMKLKESRKADEEAKIKAEAEKAKQSQDKKDFDYAEKSYLLSNGIKKEEFPYVWEEFQKMGGKDLDKLLDSKYFQNELIEKRELAASETAIPKGTKRIGGASRNDVDYWIAKGELPPPDQVELRRKVVNARIGKENTSKFTNNPVV